MLSILFILLLSIVSIHSKVTWPTDHTSVGQCLPCVMNYFNNSAGLASAGLLLQGQQSVITYIDLPPQCAIPNANGTFSFVLNVPAGETVALQVIDNAGNITTTPYLQVQVSQKVDCLAAAITVSSSTILPTSTVSAIGQVYNLPDNDHYGNKLSGGAIAGIVIGSIAALLLFAGLIYYILRSKNRSRADPSSSASDGSSAEPVLNSNSTTAPSTSSPHNSNYYPTSPSTNYSSSNNNHTNNRYSNNTSTTHQPNSPQSTTFPNSINSHSPTNTGSFNTSNINNTSNGIDSPERYSYRTGGMGYSQNVDMREVNNPRASFPAESMTPVAR